MASALGVLLGLALNCGAAVVVGSKVTFAATVDGSPVPTLQWKKDGVDIAGATGTSYIIAAVALGDAGVYRVTAANVAGSADSADAVLTVELAPLVVVNVAPTFSSQPTASLTAVAGGSVALSATATGVPAPSYQWQKNGTAIAGATNASLALTGVTAGDSGTYVLVASNSVGSVNSSAALVTVSTPVVTPPPAVVAVAPAITSQPAATQSVTTGATVQLAVQATGTPAPGFQWMKNGVAVAGATNSTLAFSSVALADAGTFSVVVANSAGSVTSATALLNVTAPVVTPPTVVVSPPTVVAPPPVVVVSGSSGTSTLAAPSISVQPVASLAVAAGAEVRLSVTASGNPAPSYQWRKNGVSLAGATTATLILTSVDAADAATYQVRVSNSVGSVVSSNAVVSVAAKPAFAKQPVSQAVALGATATFSTSVTGSPTPSLQWFKTGVAVAGATSSSLILRAVTTSDFANYTVVATNSVGSVTSDTVSLVLAATPIIVAQPVGLSVAQGANATFTVKASGSPAPTFQWKKSGKNINGATAATLTLSSVSSTDAADYTVEASNSIGWLASNRATLVVKASTATPARRRANGAVDDGSLTDVVLESRIVNLSVRSRAGSGDNGLIVGFVVSGDVNKPMLLRGVGPALTEFGVGDVLADPKLSLYSGSVMTATNDDWALDANAPEIANTGAILGAFSLREASTDSAMLANLGAGAYTVQVGGKDGETGVALVEVYDAASDNAASLVNLSVRTFVGAGGEAPNLGFVVAGNTPKRVLIRAVGPTLGAFGVSGTLDDPQLELFKNGVRVGLNDNWEGDAALSATFASVGAFGLTDVNSKDAVMLVTLEPGAYTVVASGVGGSTGIALVEVYDVP
jgi:hypothetical protein